MVVLVFGRVESSCAAVANGDLRRLAGPPTSPHLTRHTFEVWGPSHRAIRNLIAATAAAANPCSASSSPMSCPVLSCPVVTLPCHLQKVLATDMLIDHRQATFR